MKIANTLFEYINNPSYNYVPHVIFFGFILIGALFGLWLGYRSSIYFGIGVIGSLGISALLIAFIPISFLAEHLVPFKLKVGSINIQSILEKNSSYLKPVTLLLFFIASLIIVFLIQFIVYLFFRKKYFKKNIKENKANGKSNLSIRVWGVITSILFVIPFATILSSYGAIMSESGISSIYSKATTIFTFGQVSDTTENLKELASSAKSIIYLANKPEAIASLLGDQNPDTASIKEIFESPDGRAAIEEMFNSKLILRNIDIVTDQLTEDQLKNINIDDQTDISWVKKLKIKGGPIKIESAKFETFISEITKKLNGKVSKISEAGLRHLLLGSKLIITT